MALTIAREHPDSPAARALIDALDRDLHGRYPEAHSIRGLYPDEAQNPRLIFLVAYDDAAPVACGAVRELDADAGEVKRMYVAHDRRGEGIARTILIALEEYARKEGYRTLRIETGTRQHEAIGLYRSAGYRDIPPFGVYVGNPYSVCFEKSVADIDELPRS
jgi:putative acetyltransferase